ncbi:HEAT repeat domain-containing protein [Kitasatospora acidiphila]|uniref:HEAT repeat domain-containing protein n=1 Tax=Kitasatospora acidiphila TaxID=2567942 RepID=UPI003C771FB1
MPRLPGRAKSFGEEGHGFYLGPPLSEYQVSAFEAQHRVRLPTGYRRFLTEVGHRGAGPHYGLLPLWDWDQAVLRRRLPDHLARPFPVLPDVPVDRDWWQRIGKPKDPFTGAMAITSQGCSYLTLLVVSGPARGRIVNVDLDPDQPLFFSPDTDFLAWYERWLDETADGLDTSGFNLCVPGSEPSLVEALAGAREPALRTLAARTLGRRPYLASETRAVLGKAAEGDPEPEIRVIAIRTLALSPSEAELRAFRRRLTDTSPEVRAAALRALTNRGASWHAEARKLLGDEAAEVRQAALRALEVSRVLTEEDVLSLRSDTDASVRAAAINYLSILNAASAQAMARACLSDPDCHVRRAALDISIRRRWLTESDLEAVEQDSDPLVRERAAKVRTRSKWRR